jgi:hypothetical protein
MLAGQFQALFGPASLQGPQSATPQRLVQHFARLLRPIDDQHAALVVQGVTFRGFSSGTSVCHPKGEKIAFGRHPCNGSLSKPVKPAVVCEKARKWPLGATIPGARGLTALRRAGFDAQNATLTYCGERTYDRPANCQISALYPNAVSRQNTASLQAILDCRKTQSVGVLRGEVACVMEDRRNRKEC